MHVFSVQLQRQDPPVEVLLVQFSSDQSIESLLEQVYNGFFDLRVRASAIVLRPEVTENFTRRELQEACEGRAASKSPFLATLQAAREEPGQFERFAELPIFVLHGADCRPALSENINPLLGTPEFLQEHLKDPATLTDIRNAELRFIVDRSRALLRPVDGSYYEPPSQKPARSFLRVGNIQYSRQAIDAVTFWLLPYVAGTRALLVDTWSLSSIALNVSRVLAAIRNEKPVPVEMLSQYQNATEERQAALTEVLDRLVAEAALGEGETLATTCLVSATHTGSLVALLQDQVELSSLPIDLSFVSVFRLGETAGSLPALCDLSEEPEFKPLRATDLAHRSAIRIDPQIYFPLTYIEVPHLPLARDAEPFAEFLALVRGHGILSAHRDEASDGPTRHHAIHVDTERLANLPEVEAALRERVAGLMPLPTLILSPRHEAARRLAEIAASAVEERLGRAVPRIEHTNLHLPSDGPRQDADEEVKQALASIPPEGALLVLDDSFITGARMTGYQKRLRSLGVEARIHYLVAVAQPDDPGAWADFKRKLSFRGQEDRQHHRDNTIAALYEFTLPNWQTGRCPWCQESLMYQSLPHDGAALPPAIAARQSVLADKDSGLRNNLFMVEPDGEPLRLHRGSVFTEPGSEQAEVFAAVAAAIHNLRVRPPLERPALGPRRFPIATVLDDSGYLENYYTDSVLRACFLRAASCDELVHTDSEAEEARTRRVDKILLSSQGDENDLAIELVIAHAAQKCTISDTVDPSAIPPSAGTLLSLVRGERPSATTSDTDLTAF